MNKFEIRLALVSGLLLIYALGYFMEGSKEALQASIGYLFFVSVFYFGGRKTVEK
jgi:hypothetical protein